LYQVLKRHLSLGHGLDQFLRILSDRRSVGFFPFTRIKIQTERGWSFAICR